MRQRMSEIFVHAIATDRCYADPAQTVRAARRLQYSNRIVMCWRGLVFLVRSLLE
ncbi:hypothetical protein [Acetobacter orientalis]|uniref:hypothetical protein n=1 Tax=Acetobacter orientalis TaxID=146474 RepID=UPI0039E90FD4